MTIGISKKPGLAVGMLTVAVASLLALPLGSVQAADPSQPVKTIFKPAEVPDLEKIPAAGISRNFMLVDHTDLGRAGRDVNGNSLAFAGHCLYIGDRRRPGPDAGGMLVLDATSLEILNELAFVAGSNQQEHRTVDDLDLLVVMGFTRSGSVGLNILQVWDTTDCENPVLESTFDFGGGRPHEFFLWRDPNDTNRVLIYQTLSGENVAGGEEPNLRVIDVSDKADPQLVATFDARDFGIPRTEPASADNGFIRQTNGLHSLTVSDDGTRAYLAMRDAGFLILDSTPLATAASCALSHTKKKNPCLRMVNPNPSDRLDFSPPGPGRTHSAIKVPGKDLVVLTHEVLGSASCPWGWVRITDVRFEPQPKQISTFLLPENLQENCGTVGPIAIATGSDFTSHNPIPLRNLLLISWRGAGTRAIDISNPFMPHEAGFYFPQTAVGADGNRVRIHMASYPVIKDGLIYVLDRFNGLFVLRYTGPFHEEVDVIRGPCQGNASPVEDIGFLTGTCITP